MLTLLRTRNVQNQSHLQWSRQCRYFAGHNKWSKIKRKKGAKDVARAALFAKASRAIIAASKACHGDTTNLQLQSAIAHAKSIQLPKDRIQDAIDKHLHKEEDDHKPFQSVRYDAMLNLAGTKVPCIMTALTDNRHRTASTVRAAVVRAGGELLPTAAHEYLFAHVGVVMVETDPPEADELLNCALQAGATEMEQDNQSAMITCQPSDLWNLVTALQERGYNPTEFEHRYVSTQEKITLTPEGYEKLDAFLDKMEANEDVTNVYHNVADSDDS